MKSSADCAKLGLIDAQTLQPLAWENRQFGSDSDPTRAERLRKFRENKKRMRNGHETDAKRSPEEEADTEAEAEAETEVSQKREETARKRLCIAAHAFASDANHGDNATTQSRPFFR